MASFPVPPAPQRSTGIFVRHIFSARRRTSFIAADRPKSTSSGGRRLVAFWALVRVVDAVLMAGALKSAPNSPTGGKLEKKGQICKSLKLCGIARGSQGGTGTEGWTKPLEGASNGKCSLHKRTVFHRDSRCSGALKSELHVPELNMAHCRPCLGRRCSGVALESRGSAFESEPSSNFYLPPASRFRSYSQNRHPTNDG